MSRKEVNNEQAQWEREKKHKDALVRFQSISLWGEGVGDALRADGPVLRTRTRARTQIHARNNNAHTLAPDKLTHCESGGFSLALSRPSRSRVCRRKKMNEAMHWLFTDDVTSYSGQGEYDMRQKGLVPTGNFRVLTVERTWDLPGLGGGGEGRGPSPCLHAIATEPWDPWTKECPVVSSRQILKSGKHKFKIIVKKPVVGEFLASDGLIKVGFYRADSDPKLSWASPEMDGKCWHYRNIGNLWCGSQSAEESSTPGFAPGDIVTAIVNINAGTAQFCKRSLVRGRTSEEDKEFETSLASINNVQCPAAGLRFGVQVSSCTRVCHCVVFCAACWSQSVDAHA